jgi:HD-like signal output (HDOD) protein
MIAATFQPAGQMLTPDEIVRAVKRLPSAPKVLPRLKELLSDGNSAMHEIVSLVRLDPGIAARVLQMGNSAYFSPGGRCLTVDEAVNRVGFDQVYQLVSYAVASSVLVRPLVTYAIEAEELWQRSVAGALAAEVLAERSGQDRDVAYTVGLLHCVGMVAIDEWVQSTGSPLVLHREGYPREAMAAERAAFGFTQADAGGALLRHWGFPGAISEPVRWQYAPGSTPAHLRMATLLNASKWLRDAVCGHPAPLPPDSALRPLGISPAKLDLLTETVAQRFAEVKSLLEHGQEVSVDRHLFPAAASW